MTTTTAIAHLDALDQTIAFVDGVFRPFGIAAVLISVALGYRFAIIRLFQ